MRQLNLLFFLLLSTTFFAQSIEFAPPGATWQYTFEYMSSNGTLESELRTLAYTEDTEIEGVACKKLTGDDTYYLFQEDNKVFYRRVTDPDFHLMWDFGVQPGQSFTSVYNTPNQSVTFNFTCAGRETILVNGEELPLIVLEYSTSLEQINRIIAVNPRFGPITFGDGYVPFLHPGNPCCFFDMGSYDLCGYKDNTLGAFPISCQISSTGEPVRTDVVVAPNPATDQVTIQLPTDLSGEVLTAQLTDLTGRVVVEQNISAPVSTLAIPAHRCATGMYLLQIKGEKSRFKTQKLHLNGE
jgi:hypothetical protein